MATKRKLTVNAGQQTRQQVERERSSSSPQSADHRAIAKPPGISSPEWQVQTAKAQFSELFRRARTEGPQFITKQGKEGVVMISDEQYSRLVVRSRQPKSIVQFFRESPLMGLDLDLERDKDPGSDFEL